MSDGDPDRHLRALLEQAATFNSYAGHDLTSIALGRLRGQAGAVANVNEVLEALRTSVTGLLEILGSATPRRPTEEEESE